MKKVRQKIAAFLAAHPKIEKIVTTPDMRTDANLYIGFAISLIFTLFCIISGLYADVRWFMTLGIYNFVLALIRLFTALEMQRLIRHPLEDQALLRREARISYVVNVSLLLVNLAFIGLMAETIIRNNALHYHFFILDLLILFSLSRFIILSIGFLKKRGEGATLNHAIRNINMTVALGSLFTTLTAALSFYCTNEIARLVVNLIASSLIFYGLLRIAVNGILASRKALNMLKAD